MTRPRKATVDFFPHYAAHGKTMFVLDETYGIHGYYFWFRLLEMLASTDNHFIDVNNPATMRFLCAKTKTDKDKALEILNCLADMEAIDAKLWESEIIWSDKFIEGISSAYRNRLQDIPKKPDILRKKPGLDTQSNNFPAEISATNERTNEPNVPNELNTFVNAEVVDDSNGFNLQSLANLWNQYRPPEIAKVKIPFVRNEKTLKKYKAVIRLHPEQEWWIELFKRMHLSKYMKGFNKGGWRATFDWIMENAERVFDGHLIDAGMATQGERSYATAQQWVKDREAKRNESI